MYGENKPEVVAAPPAAESAPAVNVIEIPSPVNPMQCPHTQFEANVRVDRNQDTGTGKVFFSAIVNVMCKQCKSPMCFIGCEKGGGLVTKPTTDMFGLALSAPMVPGGDAMAEFFKPAPPTPLTMAVPETADPIPTVPKGPLTEGEEKVLAMRPPATT